MTFLEIEATLAICSENPELIATELAGLRAVGPYSLIPMPDLAIRDVYLDLADHALRSHGFGLRIRHFGGSHLITLKGKAQDVEGGGRSREEIELIWSEKALNSIAARLAETGLVLSAPSEDQNQDNPLIILSKMGFVADQTRDTIRRPRNVIVEGQPMAVLAEMVVDSVSFHLHGGVFRHHEVEIESKKDGGVEVMQRISKELLSEWPAALRVWDHGKRSTGKAVEALFEERGATGLVDRTGNLVPQAYDLIAAHLS